MTKYNHNQLLEIMKACVDFIEGRIDYESAKKNVQSAAENYPIHNLRREISQARKYLSGEGIYGFSYPANWAKAFIEVTNNNHSVIDALKEQQRLYLEKDGKKNMKLEEVLKGASVNPYIFKGLVLQERAQISFGPFEAKLQHLSSERNLRGKLNIVLNQLTVCLYTDEDWDIFDLRNIVSSWVNDISSIFGS